MGHFGVYLTDHNNKTLELPVAPEEFGATAEQDSAQQTVAKLGEINQIGERKLYEIEFSFILPKNPQGLAYTTAQKPQKSYWAYVDFIQKWRESKKPGRVVVSDTKFNLPVTVSKFEWKLTNGNADEYQATLTLKEWRSYEAQKLKVTANKTTAKKAKPRPAHKKIGIGTVVIVNGQLHRDSYGAGPGATERNATRKVNFMAAGRACPYHVTTLDGGWRGWVKASAVKAK